MTATLGIGAIRKASLRVERAGIAAAHVALTDDAALAVPSRQTLTIGDSARIGTVIGGGDFGGEARYEWVAGAGRWGMPVAQRPYHDAGGIMLSAVLADLAADVGEIDASLDVADRSLGTDWIRPAAVARDLLDA